MQRYILYITDNGETLRDNWRSVTVDLERKARLRAIEIVVIDLRTKSEE